MRGAVYRSLSLSALPLPAYDRLDGLGLAALIEAGEVTAAEAVEAALARVAARDPALNAVVQALPRRARRFVANGVPEGPFRGVPFLVKDLGHALAGVPLRAGSAATDGYVPTRDAELVRRWRAAGLVFVGKSSAPELGLMGVTEPEAFGPTRNPWDPSRTPGGSSGGAAAAVAARIVPVASASDGGGSIRIPASCCGLFGLKPSRGRTTNGPDGGHVWEGASVAHALTVTVRDSAALLDATHGPAPGDPYFLPPPERPYLDEVETDPRPLRIAYTATSPMGGAVHSDCRAAVEDAAALLEDLGHSVEEAAVPIDGREIARSFLTMYFGQTAATLDALDQELGDGTSKRTELTTQFLARLGRAISAADYLAATRRWNEFARISAHFHETYDFVLTPTLAEPPAAIGAFVATPRERALMRTTLMLRAGRALHVAGITDELAERSFRAFPFTQLYNMTGQPAMSVPLYWSAEGLPIGVQFAAPLGDEATLFRLAGQLERARPWADRRPPLVG